MAAPDFLAEQLTRQVVGYVIAGGIISGLIQIFRKDFENWFVGKVRSFFHPPPKIEHSEQDELTLDAPPACPRCSKPMVKRVSRKGVKSDSRFWGCSQFPSCRGTRSMTAA